MKALFKLISRFAKARRDTSDLAETNSTSETARPNLRTNSRFVAATERVAASQLFRPYTDTRNPHGFYHNRHIIGERTKIHGGIYLSALPAEAIVIDERYEMLRPIVASFRSRVAMTFQSTVQAELALLEEIFTLSDRAFAGTPEKIREFNQAHGIGTDTKVALDSYIKERLGVSRHKVLLAAYLIEKLKEEGRLTGMQTIPAQLRHADGNDEILTYTFSDGSFATFDPHADSAESGSMPKAINE